MAIVDSHNAAMTTCHHCEHRTGPGYVEPGPPFEYEAEVPVELATETPVEGAETHVNKDPFDDLIHYDPNKWASPGTIEEKPNIEKPVPEKRPAPTEPEGEPPDPEELAIDLPQAVVEEKRAKEPLVSTPDIFQIDAPAQTPAARPPPYETHAQKPPPELDLDDPDAGYPTPEELIFQYLGGQSGSGGGPSVHGWSRISNAHQCLRYYFYDFVAKLHVKRYPEREVTFPGEEPSQFEKRLNPLWQGSLMHDVRGLHLITGGMHTWDPLYAIRGLYPNYALEVYRLMKHYLESWGSGDNAKWDVRGVENESRKYFKPRRICGKARSLCVSSRHDALIHPLQQGEMRYPVGKPTPRIDINEFKSTRVLASTTVEGYRVDGQALLHCGTYKYGRAVTSQGEVLEQSSEEIYGKLNSLMLDWVVKVKNFIPSKHLIRQHYIIPEDQVQHFLDRTGDFLYEEIGKRLFHKRWQDPDLWPQGWLCRGIYYPSWICPYAPICENVVRNTKTIEASYVANEPLDRSLLVLPKKRKKRSYKRKRAAAEVTEK
jgi:hypothetical protein